MSVAPIKRNFKNVIKNYSDAQVKVREATSNDPWGPSSLLMAQISDLTYNVVAFSEIMQMIWKRLNDSGKNWRHVYKALSLLEYILKTGNEKIAQQCRENIFAIQTLKDFQYYEENKDLGLNVREKAKQIVALLKDEQRLRNERTRALKARERFLQSNHSKDVDVVPAETNDEDLELQLALALSKEEAETEKKLSQSDEVRLQLAISQSQQEISQKIEEPALIDIESNSYRDAPSCSNIDPWSTSSFDQLENNSNAYNTRFTNIPPVNQLFEPHKTTNNPFL